ncbi:MAG: hypothetical protein AAF532_09680 [Planctomycetota bacterium]
MSDRSVAHEHAQQVHEGIRGLIQRCQSGGYIPGVCDAAETALQAAQMFEACGYQRQALIFTKYTNDAVRDALLADELERTPLDEIIHRQDDSLEFIDLPPVEPFDAGHEPAGATNP